MSECKTIIGESALMSHLRAENARLAAERDAIRAEVERLTTLIDAALDASTIEINPSNYDHDQVCLLNAEMTEVCSILEAALKGGDA